MFSRVAARQTATLGRRCLEVSGRRRVQTLAPATTTVLDGSRFGVGPFGVRDGGTVIGSVAEGWEDMRAAFERNFERNLELGAQLAVYKNGHLVVDLHGYAATVEGYDGDTLQNIFSSGKNLEAISIMMLADRGLLKYEDKVADHWPAFAQHGKGDITVEDVLRHEAGLQFFADPEAPNDLSKCRVPTVADVEATASGAVEALIEGSAAWGHGRRMYHASTRGFVLGGLLRQITGQTLGQFIASEIATPLGVTVQCGATLEEQARHRYAKMQKVGAGYTLMGEVLPAVFGFGGNAETVAVLKHVIGALLMDSKHPLRGYAKAMPAEWMKGGGDVHHVCTPEGRTLEVSSGSVQANARSLAAIAGLMANGGELAGVRLASRATVDAAVSNTRARRDEAWAMDIASTQGGFFDFGTLRQVPGGLAVDPEVMAAMEGFVGWAGKGGSLFLWNRERNIGFSYTMTGMMNGGHGGARTVPFFEVLRHA